MYHANDEELVGKTIRKIRFDDNSSLVFRKSMKCGFLCRKRKTQRAECFTRLMNRATIRFGETILLSFLFYITIVVVVVVVSIIINIIATIVVITIIPSIIPIARIVRNTIITSTIYSMIIYMIIFLQFGKLILQKFYKRSCPF